MEKKKNDATVLMDSIFGHCKEGFIDVRMISKDKDAKKVRELFIPIAKRKEISNILNGYKEHIEREQCGCYFGPATHAENDGTQNGILNFPVVWVDVDFYKLSEEQQVQVRNRYAEFKLKASCIVNSGGGIHIYWLLKTAASRQDILRVKRILKQLAKFFYGDNSATDVTHLLRIPNTLNYKYTPPAKVTFNDCDPAREYDLSSFENILPEMEETPNGEERPYRQETNERLNQIMECAFLQHCNKDRATLTEPEWYAMVSILARETGGPNLTHGLSKGYPQYSPEETDKKILHAVNDSGPATCERIKTLWGCGRDCGVRSPAVLALRANQLIRKLTPKEMIEGASLETLPEILRWLAGLPETERAVHINALAKKLNIARRAIQKDIQSLFHTREDSPDIDKILADGDNPGSHYSGQNFIDGVLSYGVKLGESKFVIQSEGDPIIANGNKAEDFRFSKSALTSETIRNFRAGEDVDGLKLMHRIRTLFTDYVVLHDDRISTLLAVWVMGTYIFKVFRFYGYLWITSPVKRCGKSHVLDILSYICFNSTKRLIDLSPAYVFRETHQNDGTLILDEIEKMGGADKEQRGDLISLLNSGFEKNGVVPRMEKRGDGYISLTFNTYSPKAMAGIRSVVDTIEDRSFKIQMIRKTKSESVKRFNMRVLDSEMSEIRRDCFIWALRNAGDISEIYDKNLEGLFPGVQDLDDRQLDIFEPLLCIAFVIDTLAEDKTRQTVKILSDLALDMGKTREDQESLRGGVSAAINLMQGLLEGEDGLFVKDELFVSAETLFPRFQADEDLGFIHSKRGLSFFLDKLGMNRIQRREGKDVVRGYVVKKAWVQDLKARYG